MIAAYEASLPWLLTLPSLVPTLEVSLFQHYAYTCVPIENASLIRVHTHNKTSKHQTTASIVLTVEAWLKPLLPEHTTTHPFSHLDAFISGAIKQDFNPAAATTFQKIINQTPPDFPDMDWSAFQATITQALNALEQALEAPEALSSRLKQLDPNSDSQDSVLQELHDIIAGFELQPVLLELQAVLAACPAPPTAPLIAPETPPTDLAAALGKVIPLSGVESKRQELLTGANSNLKHLVLALIDALGAVAKAGTSETIHRVETLRQCAQCVDASAPPPAEALPEAWEELCQAHEKLSLLEHNGLQKIAQWQPPTDYEHQDWYLAFVHHKSQALLQQLQDMIDWQATTLSVLTSCMSHVNSLTQDVDDESAAAHEELTKVETEIQNSSAALQLVPKVLRSALEQELKKLETQRDTLRQQLSDQPRVDHVVELARLLQQHFPALLVFLHPEQSTLGARLRTVLGPDLPASLILEAMTEVDRTLSLSNLGQLDLHYNQNHKVYKTHAVIPDFGEQDLAVKDKGLVHRDVKLSNVMLDGAEDQPVVRLGDFDITKAAAEATMLPYGIFKREMMPSAFLIWRPSCVSVQMCDAVSNLYKETRAFLATDSKQRPSLFSAGQIVQQSAFAQAGPAIDVLRDAPELIPEVGELLKQLNTDGRGPANIAVQRVERVHNPVLWERYSAKRREMLHRIKSQEHYDQLQASTLDAPSGSPALLRDTSCQERLLLHGIGPDTMLRDKIVRLGLDYRFAGSSAGHRFGLGVYLADHPGKSHQYARAGPNDKRMLIITRALLGHAHAHPSPRAGAVAPPLLPDAPNNERYDSVIATPPGQFHEVIVFENAQIYPELVVHYTAN
ncbi:uncharacterized protein MONBRDRAFT_29987 [Monosiga brevicollis MX1]|uniref:Protein kinase domain-containing protein n=1 Tax=Monosiga brevicollis TaxID=81824 RepID=A9VCP4_MONBE|nr:uncharacterized protein MONBRDRAFT_29987 [Monosiga brevicollis MX1]EDQ84723.1 predicted protein [Monosiga brevicollis MX1]|eukprot:XP_001750509.1 hypothetical protein [Monosiga brevicollis MX1]